MATSAMDTRANNARARDRVNAPLGRCDPPVKRGEEVLAKDIGVPEPAETANRAMMVS